MKFDIILRVSAKVFVPLVLLFALYVQFHGEYGPGGGFQAGVILASALILYTLIFGFGALKKILTIERLHLLIPAGVLLYALVGVLLLALGGNYLEYTVLMEDQVHAQEWGIFLIELGVFFTVAGTLSSIFLAFVERGRR